MPLRVMMLSCPFPLPRNLHGKGFLHTAGDLPLARSHHLAWLQDAPLGGSSGFSGYPKFRPVFLSEQWGWSDLSTWSHQGPPAPWALPLRSTLTHTGHVGHVQLEALKAVTGVALPHAHAAAILTAVQDAAFLCLKPFEAGLVLWSEKETEALHPTLGALTLYHKGLLLLLRSMLGGLKATQKAIETKGCTLKKYYVSSFTVAETCCALNVSSEKVETHYFQCQGS